MSWNQNFIEEEELARHNTEDDAWVRIDNTVYNVSKFHNLHPGGSKILTALAGKDATKQFYGLHRQEVLHTWAPKLAIGRIATAQDVDPASDMQTRADISTVPYGEHMAWSGFKVPHYFTDSHLEFRKALRKWVNDELVITGIGEKHEESQEKPSEELFMKMGSLGILAARLGPGTHLKTWKEQCASQETGGKIFGKTRQLL